MNFRRILSKSSIGSSLSSDKDIAHTEEVTKLHGEIESLKQTIDALKISVESRDAAIGTLAREKEKIYVDFKSVQRTNRNLHQQLTDERDIHSKEKEFLITEIGRLKPQAQAYIAEQNNEVCDTYPSTLHEQIKSKDEVIFNMGAKFMKIKSSKTILQKKFDRLQAKNKKICESVVLLLRENRKALDNLLDKLLSASSHPPDSKKYLKLLKINANLHYENTRLKIIVTSQQDGNVIGNGNDKHSENSTVHYKATKCNERTYTFPFKAETQNNSLYSTTRQFKSRFRDKLPRYRYMENFALLRGNFKQSISDPCISKIK